jgi:hypothetical protein
MPTQITLGQLAEAKPALDKLLKMTFSMATSYALARRARVVNSELAEYNKKLNDLIAKLGSPLEKEPDKIGISPTRINPETKVVETNPSWAEFLKKRNELLAVEVPLEVEPIKLTDLTTLPYAKDCPKCGTQVGEIPEHGPTGQDLLQLGPLLVE